MPRLEISVLPIDGIRDFSTSSLISSLIILSKEKGIICKMTSNGAIIQGEKDTILQILKEIDSYRLGTVGKKFSITVDFADNDTANLTVVKDKPNSYEKADAYLSHEDNRTMANKDRIHDMVLTRLSRYVS